MTNLFIEHAGLEFEVEVTSFFSGRPARISGPPEDCHPEEFPDLEYHIVSVTLPEDGAVDLADIDEDVFEQQVMNGYIEEFNEGGY